MISPPLTGLIAAVYTPFDADGELRVSMIERQAQGLIESGASGVFVAGTTGESHSLSMDERIELARRWADVVSGTPLKLVIHVGHNSLPEAVVLARQAAQIGADAIAALAPSYFKPASVEQLVDFCEPLARAAGDTPFYYYDIPGMTGVVLPMARFLEQGKSRIPTLRGMKYSNGNLPQLQECLRLGEGEFDVLFGSDEALLAALALGVRGGGCDVQLCRAALSARDRSVRSRRLDDRSPRTGSQRRAGQLAVSLRLSSGQQTADGDAGHRLRPSSLAVATTESRPRDRAVPSSTAVGHVRRAIAIADRKAVGQDRSRHLTFGIERRGWEFGARVEASE
ncbi:MAG: dihydrodipicolinate synthase family protein [Pirellulaceae bacterium]